MIDPDSKSQNYENMFKKYQDGQILFSFWPWLGQSAYNTEENMQAGKGFMIAPIDDLEIISYGCNPLGNHKTIIGIGSNTKDPERLVDFIDWLYSPEGIFISGAKSSAGTAGIEGLTWELIDGEPVLTDFGVQAFYNPSVEMPEEWGGGTWNEGICELNYKPVSGIEISPDGEIGRASCRERVLRLV